MSEDPNLQPVGYVPEDSPVADEPVERKKPRRAGRLAGVLLLALLGLAALVYFTPSLRQELLPQAPNAPAAPTESTSVNPGPLAAVPVLWERLDLGAMPAGVAQNLKWGKYYYDKHVTGNFGLAIGYWERALTETKGASRDPITNLITSAERELAAQFSVDSGDVVVLLKQGKRDQAVILLEKMRADYTDITAPQYVWTSVMLSRRRR